MCASIHKNVPIFGDDKNEGYRCKKEKTSPANASFNKNVHVELLEVKNGPHKELCTILSRRHIKISFIAF